MSYTLRETEWAKAAIEANELGKSPYETLRRVARFYLDQGKSRNEARAATEDFLLSCDKTASPIKWAKTLDAAVSFAMKHPAVNINSISVTEAEMRMINNIESGFQAKRLAFTLLCLSKYWNGSAGVSSYWVNSSDTEIMQLANIKTSVKRQCKLYHDLRETGLISFSHKVDCNHVRVNFADEECAAALEITDLRNLGNQYLMYLGEPYFQCAECGLVTKRSNVQTGRRQKYCSECAAKVKVRKTVDAAKIKQFI